MNVMWEPFMTGVVGSVVIHLVQYLVYRLDPKVRQRYPHGVPGHHYVLTATGGTFVLGLLFAIFVYLSDYGQVWETVWFGMDSMS